jgi:mono/diheme cytochrome c family protein
MTNAIFGIKTKKMKKLVIISSIAFGAVFMAQCTPKASKAISETHVMTKEEAIAGNTPEQLEQGKVLFTGNCAKCHGLKEPGSRTPEQWERVLKRMIPKAKLSEEDGKLVKAYLIANSKQG